MAKWIWAKLNNTVHSVHSDRNKPFADRILTDIQNGVVTEIKSEQIQQKKAVKNELKDVIKKLGALNNALEKTQDEVTLNGHLKQDKHFNQNISITLEKKLKRPPCSDMASAKKTRLIYYYVTAK